MLRWMPAVALAGAVVAGSMPVQAQWNDLAAKDQAAKAEADRREAEVRDAAVKQELAARVFAAREAAARRTFDADYRSAFVRALAERPLGDLQAMADGHAPVPPLNLGDTGADLVYTPIAPCRVLDTRFAGGPIGGGSQLSIKVAGALTGQGGAADCQVPAGPATAAVLNFVAVNAIGAGNLRAFAFGGPVPTASIVNYAQVTGLNLANGVVIPLCDPSVSTCTNDVTIQADGGATQIVVDVLGYFRNTRKEQVRSFSVLSSSAATTAIAATCTNYAGGQVTVVAPGPGRVVVQAQAWLQYTHNFGASEDLIVYVGANATDCSAGLGYSTSIQLPAAYPTTALYGAEDTIPVLREFTVGAAGSYTYYLNGTSSPANAFRFWFAGMTATFHPN